jgi:hypothetical protein
MKAKKRKRVFVNESPNQPSIDDDVRTAIAFGKAQVAHTMKSAISSKNRKHINDKGKP